MKTIYDVNKEHLEIVAQDVLRRTKMMHEELTRRIEEGSINDETKANYGGAIVSLVKLYMDYQAVLEELSGAPTGPAAKEVENLLNDVLINLALGGYNKEGENLEGKGAGSDEPTNDLDEGGEN